MKRATRNPVGAGLLERHIVLHDADNVRLAFEIVDESLRETHWVKSAVVILGVEENLRA